MVRRTRKKPPFPAGGKATTLTLKGCSIYGGKDQTQAVAYRSNLALGYGNGGQGHRGTTHLRQALKDCGIGTPATVPPSSKRSSSAATWNAAENRLCRQKRACPLLCRCEDDAHRRRRHDGRMGEESGTHRARGAARRHLLQGRIEAYTKEITSETALVRQAVRPQGFGCMCPSAERAVCSSTARSSAATTRTAGIPVFRLKANRTLSDDEIQ